MKAAENIEKLIKAFFETKKSAAVSSQMDEKILGDALAAFEKSKTNTSANLRPGVWRIIMKSSITKLAIAAVLLVAAVMFMTFLHKSATPAYAFEQTMAAVDGMRYFHFKQFVYQPDRRLGKEAWVEYGPTGMVKNVRFDVYDVCDNSNNKGKISQSVVWKEGKAECWKVGQALIFFEDADYTAKILFFASRYNPKGALEYLESLEKEGKVKIQIEEPTTSQDDILVTAIYKPNTYLLQRQMPAIKDVYHIDNVSRLVKAVEIFYLNPNGPRAIGSWEYCDYNQPFAPELLDLNKEAPPDVNRIDMMAMDIGIEQGDLSDSAIAVEAASQFLDALIHKDYALAGKLVSEEMTEQQVRQKYENLHILEVISIGEPKMDKYMSWIVPVKVMIEKDGKTIEREFTLRSGKVLGHPSRRAVETPELK
jgi:hypothetical protein